MALLNLTIDLPESAYSITDPPTTAQRIINALISAFSASILILAAIGNGVIDAVLILGTGIEWLIDVADVVLTKLDNVMVAAIGWLASAMISRVAIHTV